MELCTPDFKYPPGQWAERKRAPPVPVIKVLKLEVLDYQVRVGGRERKRVPPVPVIKVLKLEVLDYQVKAGAALCEDRGSRHNQPISFTLMRHLSCPIKGSAPLKT